VPIVSIRVTTESAPTGGLRKITTGSQGDVIGPGGLRHFRKRDRNARTQSCNEEGLDFGDLVLDAAEDCVSDWKDSSGSSEIEVAVAEARRSIGHFGNP
jgi:hypothetical protein